MKDYCDYFHLTSDMNYDGVFTISDVGEILDFFCLLPAKAAMLLISNSEALVEFFEIDCLTGTSWGGWIFSLIFWTILISGIISDYKERKFAKVNS